MSDVVDSDPEGQRSRTLVGRARERAAIGALLEGARDGTSGAVVVAGGIGVGKSSLLRDAIDAASDFRVLRVAGVESEMAFGFAGVHQLVLPFARLVDALAGPQRAALQTVLGTAHGDPPDPYLVGLAVLSLLAGAAAAQPVLVVVDEAQWLDEESLTVVSFVARRLQADRVALVVAIRTTPNSPVAFEGVRRIEVTGLDPDAALELLTAASGGAIARDVADRLVAATDGNPLALVELPDALTADQLRGAAPLPDPLPIGTRLASVFESRLRTLDEDARGLLLLASAERLGDPRLLQRAATAILHRHWDDAVAAAEKTGLVAFTPGVEFRHPLVRSAVYYSATPAQRRAAHAALAEVLDAESDADRRAWHLGAAAAEPDERIAHELETASERLRRRGGASVAAAYLWRAAELTPDQSRATDRLLEAARTELTAGRNRRAQEILDRATTTGLDLRHRGDAAWTAVLIHLVAGDVRAAGDVLARTLPDVSDTDAELALGICVAADAVALGGARLVDDATLSAVAEGTRRLCPAPHVATPLPQLLMGVAARLESGDGDAVPLLRAAVTAATEDSVRFEQGAGHHVHVVYFDTVLAAVGTLDDAGWDELTRSWVELARRAGALAALPLALGFRSWLEVLQGRFGSAASHLAEAEDLASVTGVRGLLGTPAPARVLADAWRGNEEATRTGARRMMQEAHDRGQGIAIDQAYAALTVLEIGGGRYDVALRTARRGVEHGAIGLRTIALADLVECATRCGEPDVAESVIVPLAEQAEACGTPWARGLLARSRALLATGDSADELFRAAIDELARSTIATEHARTNLLYGEWLRRARRRRDARQPLHDALEAFEAFGASRFAARAGTELAATGEHVRKRDVPSTTALTPKEAQIARLAAAGERNHEIAAQLFITTSTVEYHLRKVFVKLGVTSRTQLAQVDLPD
ncbi:MAG TPA: AAA family ATPase [Acidimicrobiia bacterium]|nr:AAA family ATPase [Acidimicrobiia bacterium]